MLDMTKTWDSDDLIIDLFSRKGASARGSARSPSFDISEQAGECNYSPRPIYPYSMPYTLVNVSNKSNLI